MGDVPTPENQQWAYIFNEFGQDQTREMLWSILEALEADGATSVDVRIAPDGDGGYDVAVSGSEPDIEEMWEGEPEDI